MIDNFENITHSVCAGHIFEPSIYLTLITEERNGDVVATLFFHGAPESFEEATDASVQYLICMITCTIVEDEIHAINVLKNYISQVPYPEQSGALTSPSQALASLHEDNRVQLIFLDIRIPNISGLEFVKEVQKNCHFIIATAYNDFAAEGFDSEPVDYLVKPIPFPRFLKAVGRAISLISRQPETQATQMEDEHLFLKTVSRGKVLKMNLSDID